MRTEKTTYSPSVLQKSARYSPAGVRAEALRDGRRNGGNSLMNLCHGIHQERNFTRGRTDSPQKEGIRIACREQGPGTAQVPWCFVLPSWLCAGSSSIYHFHFLKIGTILLSVSTVWFFLYAKGYPCSGFLLFPSGTQCDWCVPYSTKLSLADPILSPELHYPLKGNSSHKVRNRGIWALVIFQGITVLAHVEIIHMC